MEVLNKKDALCFGPMVIGLLNFGYFSYDLETFALPFCNDMGRMTSSFAYKKELFYYRSCFLTRLSMFTTRITFLWIVSSGFDGSVHALH